MPCKACEVCLACEDECRLWYRGLWRCLEMAMGSEAAQGNFKKGIWRLG